MPTAEVLHQSSWERRCPYPGSRIADRVAADRPAAAAASSAAVAVGVRRSSAASARGQLPGQMDLAAGVAVLVDLRAVVEKAVEPGPSSASADCQYFAVESSAAYPSDEDRVRLERYSLVVLVGLANPEQAKSQLAR